MRLRFIAVAAASAFIGALAVGVPTLAHKAAGARNEFGHLPPPKFAVLRGKNEVSATTARRAPATRTARGRSRSSAPVTTSSATG